ncbi:MAG: FixH family protein [Rhodospirillales bacterium]|nr:FixH family protein [Rhodospirillales bacterium]MDE0380886.1 FixH family protein [Rhodospirillales bacterium]
MRIPIGLLALSAMLAASGPALAGERVAADVSCSPAAEKLTFDCMIMLKGKKSGDPVEGAEVVVKADMPSMPLAHNVRPVEAAPGSMPGHYTATLELEMLGEWALTLDVSGPTRDRIVKKLDFGPASGEMEHSHDEMEHSHGEMAE